MISTLARIFKSLFAMPVWVIVWMLGFLIPANLSGLFLLDYVSGFWVALLGATAIAINAVIVFANGGFSKVLAIPHLVFWAPLQVILLYRYFTVPDMSNFEQNYILVVLIINGVSLVFDIFDTKEWLRGNRDVVGLEGEPVKF